MVSIFDWSTFYSHYRPTLCRVYVRSEKSKQNKNYQATCVEAQVKPTDQARNQLGTPGGAKSFLRGAQIF